MGKPTSSRTSALPPNIICSAWPSALRERKVKPKDDTKPVAQGVIESEYKCLQFKILDGRYVLLTTNNLQPQGAGFQKIGLDSGEQMQAFFTDGLPREAGLDDTNVELKAVVLPATFQFFNPSG